MAHIIPFQSSINTCYLVKEKGAILIDGGIPGIKNTFLTALSEAGILAEEIQLIILTHGDFDHVGGASELQKLTGAKIVMHSHDRENLEKGIFHWPKGQNLWGKVSRTLLKPFMQSKVNFPTAKVDIIVDDEGLSLQKYGIEGQIVYTPGHTKGSISVVLESGDAFVGCMAHNRLPFVFKPKLPIYADDLELIKESWVQVINLGATAIYPGHGKSFPVEKITKYLN